MGIINQKMKTNVPRVSVLYTSFDVDTVVADGYTESPDGIVVTRGAADGTFLLTFSPCTAIPFVAANIIENLTTSTKTLRVLATDASAGTVTIQYQTQAGTAGATVADGITICVQIVCQRGSW